MGRRVMLICSKYSIRKVIYMITSFFLIAPPEQPAFYTYPQFNRFQDMMQYFPSCSLSFWGGSFDTCFRCCLRSQMDLTPINLSKRKNGYSLSFGDLSDSNYMNLIFGDMQEQKLGIKMLSADCTQSISFDIFHHYIGTLGSFLFLFLFSYYFASQN